jgi:hypothetical protein
VALFLDQILQRNLSHSYFQAFFTSPPFNTRGALLSGMVRHNEFALQIYFLQQVLQTLWLSQILLALSDIKELMAVISNALLVDTTNQVQVLIILWQCFLSIVTTTHHETVSRGARCQITVSTQTLILECLLLAILSNIWQTFNWSSPV